jgi:glycosyltransferase involved in cell wall biosynthesis
MITTFNRTEYLEQALTSVLVQDPGPDAMQIEVVDDSSENPAVARMVRELGGTRVSLYQRPERGGLVASWNTCLARSRGHWVHLLHDDDYVLPGFYSALQQGFLQDSRVGAAFCRHLLVDEQGVRLEQSPLERETPGIVFDWLDKIAVSQRIMFPAIVVRRSTYERLGGFLPELVHAIDWEMWRRIAAHYPVWFEPETLACYRLHLASVTSHQIRTGENIADIRRSIDVARNYLPQEEANDLSRQAREYYAQRALDAACVLLAKQDQAAAKAQIREAMRCSLSPDAISRAAHLLAVDMPFAMWLNQAFDAYHRGDMRTARSYLWRGLIRSPWLVFNTGVVSVVAGTVLGPDTLHGARQTARRLLRR